MDKDGELTHVSCWMHGSSRRSGGASGSTRSGVSAVNSAAEPRLRARYEGSLSSRSGVVLPMRRQRPKGGFPPAKSALKRVEMSP